MNCKLWILNYLPSHDRQDKFVSKLITGLPFRCREERQVNDLYAILSEEFIKDIFEHIERFFLTMMVDDDEISLDTTTKYLTEEILLDDERVLIEDEKKIFLEGKEKDIFEDLIDIIMDANSSFHSIFIDRDDTSILESIDLFFDRREGPSELGFQSSHRHTLSTENQIFENICLRFRSKKFFYIHETLKD